MAAKTRKKQPVKTGRPLKEVDPKQVETLASIQCTLTEMAAVLDCSVRTLQRRFGAVIERGREGGRASLKRLQWKAAAEGNTRMLIWLGKQHLGQTEKFTQAIRQDVHHTYDLTILSDDELEILEKLAEKATATTTVH